VARRNGRRAGELQMSKAAAHRRRVRRPATPRTRNASPHIVERELETLKDDNRCLRESAVFFGELAERLAAQLRKEKSQTRGGGKTRRL
jgi:hypothetical protein